MLTKNKFDKMFKEILAMKDIPDAMEISIIEVTDAFIDNSSPSEDFTDLAYWVDEVFHEEGFPPVFFPE